MYEPRMGVVPEIETGKIEEVDDEDELCPDEVGTDKKHDECEVEKVVDYEVRTNSSGSIDIVHVSREERPNVARLANEEC